MVLCIGPGQQGGNWALAGRRRGGKSRPKTKILLNQTLGRLATGL
ncbi:hypothetical protein [Azospirillum doebereinerae]